MLLGSDAKALFKFPEINEMTDRVQLQFKDIRMMGKDCRITAVIDQS
jgi:riboflavin biosynthesis pyrimidine reductase